MWSEVKLVVQPDVRRLCMRPYHGHPRGCLNYGKRDSCPPKAPPISETLDLSRPTFVIWNCFHLDIHVAKMKTRHPEWSERQLHCCLYWQGTARKRLGEKIQMFLVARPDMVIVHTPEAQGVNVTATMRRARGGRGTILEWPPRFDVYQVAVAGYSKKKMRRRGV